MAAAQSLLDNKHYRHALFFAHLALEKVLKALVVKHTGAHAPPIHNLVNLAEMSGIEIDNERVEWLRKFNVFNIAGRYTERGSAPVTPTEVKMRFNQALEMMEWIKTKS